MESSAGWIISRGWLQRVQDIGDVVIGFVTQAHGMGGPIGPTRAEPHHGVQNAPTLIEHVQDLVADARAPTGC